MAVAWWLLAQTLCAEPVLSPSERETIARRGVARPSEAATDTAAAASAGLLEELGVNSAFPVRVRAAAPPRALQPAMEPGRSVLWAPPPPPESDLNPPSGACVDGVCRDGVGKFIWASGDQYEGEWDEKSRPHGRGGKHNTRDDDDAAEALRLPAALLRHPAAGGPGSSNTA